MPSLQIIESNRFGEHFRQSQATVYRLNPLFMPHGPQMARRRSRSSLVMVRGESGVIGVMAGIVGVGVGDGTGMVNPRGHTVGRW